jgi:hypothetical protein
MYQVGDMVAVCGELVALDLSETEPIMMIRYDRL